MAGQHRGFIGMKYVLLLVFIFLAGPVEVTDGGSILASAAPGVMGAKLAFTQPGLITDGLHGCQQYFHVDAIDRIRVVAFTVCCDILFLLCNKDRQVCLYLGQKNARCLVDHIPYHRDGMFDRPRVMVDLAQGNRSNESHHIIVRQLSGIQILVTAGIRFQ